MRGDTRLGTEARRVRGNSRDSEGECVTTAIRQWPSTELLFTLGSSWLCRCLSPAAHHWLQEEEDIAGLPGTG